MKRYLIFYAADWDCASGEDLFWGDSNQPFTTLLLNAKHWRRGEIAYILDHQTGEWIYFRRIAPRKGTWEDVAKP